MFRANRTHPPGGGLTGFTYNHQPYLTYWRNRFILQFLSAQFQEHEPPTYTSIVTSDDGYTWSPPRMVFPEYQLPAINRDGVNIPAGTFAVMHQRMGFYAAPNGRLLTLGFYGFAETPQQSPNAGNGLGRVVREIYADGTFGPIYFIRYNRHAGFDESNTAYPFFATSKDAGFLEACQTLLADKLYTLQWWEEDRARDGFYSIVPDEVAGAVRFDAKIVTSAGAGKAFAWYTRPDSVVVGLWKNQYSALTGDHGKTWTPIVKNATLRTTGAKTWGQRTDDGRYVIVHAHSATMVNRFPMVAITGDDAHLFDGMYCLQGEVPPRRYRGQYKMVGPQYFRGIEEGNGNPPGDHLWMVYSMHKEDIWISRTTLPITGRESAPVAENFENNGKAADFARWSLYLPQWTQLQVVAEPGGSNHVLELRDEDPHDYLLAERVFPSASRVHIRLRVQSRQIAHSTGLEIEVQSQRAQRPMRLRLNQSWLSYDHGRRAYPEQVRVGLQRWYDLELDLDCATQSYSLKVDGQVAKADIPFTEKTDALERIVFRTGPYRGQVPPHLVNDGGERPGGVDAEDLPGGDERAAPSVYWIDDLQTR
ncbi:MAG: hypothetical protein EXS38_04760 [Opitutus sp.]|nr:hypothetical protein [Opitutus sp.]